MMVKWIASRVRSRNIARNLHYLSLLRYRLYVATFATHAWPISPSTSIILTLHIDLVAAKDVNGVLYLFELLVQRLSLLENRGRRGG